MKAPVLTFAVTGTGHCLYTEAIDLPSLGTLEISRASAIEFNNQAQQWQVRGVDGVLLFSNPSRQACLDWEQQYYEQTHPPGVDVPLGLKSRR